MRLLKYYILLVFVIAVASFGSADSLLNRPPLPIVAFTTHERPTRCRVKDMSKPIPKRPLLQHEALEARGKNFIFESLSSFLLASSGYPEIPEIHLVVGGGESAYLNNLKHHTNLYIHPMSEADLKRVEGKKGNWRGGYNYARCLQLALMSANTNGVLIAEDDVVFTNDFWIRFQRLRDQISTDFPGQDYILDCYERYNIPKALPGREYGQYHGRSFCCTQLMYYTRGAAEKVLKHFEKELAEHPIRLGYDITIKHAYQEGILMFGASPTLIQHIGVTSSIGSAKFHFNKFFEHENEVPLEYSEKGAIIYDEEANEAVGNRQSRTTEQLQAHEALLEQLRLYN